MRVSNSGSSAKYEEYEEYDSDYCNMDNGIDSDYRHNDEQNSAMNKSEFIIEKILGRKYIAEENHESFYIKWKNLSYLHASWELRSHLESIDPQGRFKIKRFLLNPQAPGIMGKLVGYSDEVHGDEAPAADDTTADVVYFNPEYVEVQRVISCECINVSHAKAKHPSELMMEGSKSKSLRTQSSSSSNPCDPEDDVKYLVKWRGLSYGECSWESWADIRERGFYREVFAFWQLQIPPKIPLKPIKFPSLQDYHLLETSPIFGLTKSYQHHADDDDCTFEEGKRELVVSLEADASAHGLKLRDYQLEGVNWLLWNWWHKRSCILADEMGLGKTIQTVGFLHQLRFMSSTQIAGPFLVIAPLSLVDQWQSELNTWSPQMNTILLHGSTEARETIMKHEFYYHEPFTPKSDVVALRKRNVCKFHILLTTFEVATKEIRTLSRVQWQVLIIDEAHKLKNPESKLFSCLVTIPRQHCVLLTGTPLQNRTEELWALLNFADPLRFKSLPEFIHKFGSLKDAQQVAQLHDMLRPYLLRRIKEDVEKSLPPKEETIIEVTLTSMQKRFYRAIYEKNTEFLFKGLKASNQPSLMNIMMELRKCCNHPYLVKGVEDRVLSELSDEEKLDDNVIFRKLIETSGKFVLLDKLLPRLYSQGHKVLVFSQMVRVLNLLEDFMRFKGYIYERLDGSTKSTDRKEAVDRFCKPSMDRFIMLMSTKAGGLGLNLTAADTVIIFDSDWNPQNDLQAQARAHRIGQTKSVMIYRLLTRKTYEMEMFHQASMKLGLDRAVLAHARNEQEDEADEARNGGTMRSKGRGRSRMGGVHQKRGGGVNGDDDDEDGTTGGMMTSSSSRPNGMNVKEIDELLKRGAYNVFRDDDTEQNDFVEADIDTLLQRSAHRVTYDNSNNNGSTKVASTLGKFSKASFVSADEKEDVDINDPDFWRKAIGLSENTVGLLDDPPPADETLPQQRVRKQTKAYSDLYGTHLNEEQLKEFLKPLKPEKPLKSTSTAQEKKEAAQKERQAKEELKQMKLAAELKAKNDPSTWGPHARDRLLRALNLYGFGRWERIKSESGSNDRDPRCLELFCKFYLYQCGIAASCTDSLRDSDYIKETILTSKQVELLVKTGQKVITIPPTLVDDRFMSKMRAGQARKSLNKLDLLSKMYNVMTKVVEDVFKERQLELPSSSSSSQADLDVLIHTTVPPVSTEELTRLLYLGDVRPAWAHMRTWWDMECDKHLIIGIFRHGYGRYDLVKEDQSLVFHSKLLLSNQGKEEEGCVTMGTDLGGGVVAVGGSDDANNVYQDDDFDEMMAEHDDAVDDAVVDDEEMLAMMQQPNNSQVNNNASGPSNSSLNLPDARSLNRLLLWLVGNDHARMTREELMEKQRVLKANEENERLAKVEHDKQRTVRNVFNDVKIHDSSSSSSSLLRIEDGQALEKVLLGKTHERIEIEALSAVYKSHVQGLKKCELFLKQPLFNDDNAVVAHEGNPSVDGTVDRKDLVSYTTEDGNAATEDYKMDEEEPCTVMSEEEATRLSAAIVLFGAPMPYAIQTGLSRDVSANAFGFEVVNSKMGDNDLVPFDGGSSRNHHKGVIIDNDDDDNNNDISSRKKECDDNEMRNRIHAYDWSDLLLYSGITSKTAREVEEYYYSSWIPFCSVVATSRKALSLSQNKYVVPNPLRKQSDHHFAARGLCQLFLIRQQLMYAAWYVLTEEYTTLIQYLKTNHGSAAARSVDSMPVWWCPWIHDVGLLLGCVKHGYLAMQQIMSDPELPFERNYLDKHIRQVFIYGSRHVEPAGVDELTTPGACESFVQATILQFPDLKDLEFRMMRVLQDMTCSLPNDYFFRIECFGILSSAPFAPANVSILTKRTAHPTSDDGAIMTAVELNTKEGSMNEDSNNGNAQQISLMQQQQQLYDDDRGKTLMPCMSLKTFLRHSEKRRKLHLQQTIASCYRQQQQSNAKATTSTTITTSKSIR